MAVGWIHYLPGSFILFDVEHGVFNCFVHECVDTGDEKVDCTEQCLPIFGQKLLSVSIVTKLFLKVKCNRNELPCWILVNQTLCLAHFKEEIAQSNSDGWILKAQCVRYLIYPLAASNGKKPYISPTYHQLWCLVFLDKTVEIWWCNMAATLQVKLLLI